MESALNYRNIWNAHIEQCRRKGLPLPDPVPHPDTISIIPTTGEVVIDGPMTPQQRNAARELCRLYLASLERAKGLRRKLARCRDDQKRKPIARDLAEEDRLSAKLEKTLYGKDWLMRELQSVQAELEAERETAKNP